ncbi:MAG: 2Fe-2S iron-sulfur cluster-binding protein [Pseudomonadota bacterium]
MSKFHPLTVTDIHRTIRDAVVLTLQPEDPERFAFTQGQYLTLRHDFDGVELRRNYSICAGVDDGALRVGIKKVDGGAFSTFANTELKVGDTLEAMPPQGHFFTPLSSDQAKAYIGFAAGSGVTPILSILKSVLTREPKSTFTLVYGNKAVNTIMFREELEDLKNRYMGRLNVIHVLGSGQDIPLFEGRIDADKCAALFRLWIDPSELDTAFICGPEPMMHAVAGSLRDHGLAEDQIKFELFTESQQGRLARKARAAAAEAQSGTALTVVIEGAQRSFEMSKGQTLLDAALENGQDAPYACKAGVCSTCMCKVLKGKVEMIANHALEDYEVERGYVLSCQTYPVDDDVMIDFDTH